VLRPEPDATPSERITGRDPPSRSVAPTSPAPIASAAVAAVSTEDEAEAAEVAAWEAVCHRVDGVLLLDGAPWSGGVVTFERLDAAGQPTAEVLIARTGEGGAFSLDLPDCWATRRAWRSTSRG
jgi:hypothetical protein